MSKPALVLLSLVFISCAQNNSSNDGNGNPNPGGVGTLETNWTEIIREETCTPPRNEPMCIQGKFVVDNSARFTFESDVLESKSGELTNQEFTQLSNLIEKVDFDDLNDEFTCAEVLSIPELNSNLLAFRLPDGELATAYEFAENGQCYRLPPEQANQLNLLMRSFTQKYFR